MATSIPTKIRKPGSIFSIASIKCLYAAGF